MKGWRNKTKYGLQCFFDVLARSLGLNMLPRYLWFEVTDRCNSKCRYCNIWRKTKHRTPLTVGRLRGLFSSRLFRNIQYILNSGGEPTVRKDLVELLLMEHEVFPNATIQLSTNGLRKDKVLEAVNVLSSNGVVLSVGVSLDSLSESNDNLRGVPGAREKVIDLLESLQPLQEQGKVKVTVGITFTNKNEADLENTIKYVRGLGFQPLLNWYNTSGFYDNFESEVSCGKSIELLKKYFPDSAYRDHWIKSLRTGDYRFNCWALRSFFVLKCDGTASTCLSHYDWEFGNMACNEPSYVWEDQPSNVVRAKVAKCEGCCNNWGVGWSFQTEGYKRFKNYVRRKIFGSKDCIRS